MNRNHIIKSLNLTKGDSLTLEKANDRMEFEMLPLMMEDLMKSCTCNDGSTYTSCDCNGTNSICSDNNTCINTTYA